jgi:tetratricopeptide (TPR) repeat protein
MGVVHRDVKPSNLLIDAQGHLWITDFGLAMTQTDAGLTMTGDLLGTLRYMSPEQAAGKRLPLDHRTDVYSLGITLYELLAGRPAFDTIERGELLRAIAEFDPPPLGKLAPSIPADLETIVHKAIEKETADRYTTSNELAIDLRNFLENRPVMARSPSLAFKARKWARRHVALITVSAAILLLAVTALATSTFLIGREANRAEENFSLALAALEDTLAESVVGDLIIEPLDAKRAELERRGIAFYEEFARANGVDPTHWLTYRLLTLNQLLDKAVSVPLGDTVTADRAYHKAISEATKLVDATSGEARSQAMLIHAVDNYSARLGNSGRAEEAMRQSLLAGELAQQLAKEYPDFAQNAYLQGKNLYNRALRYEAAGKPADEQRTYREALALLEKACEAEPDELRNIHMLAMCQYNLARYLGQRGEASEAAELWEQSLRSWDALVLLRPLSSEYHSRLGATNGNLATLARDRGDFEKSSALAEEAVVHQKRALKTPPVYQFANDFLRQHYKLLSQSLWKLEDHAALAALSDERIQLLPDVPWEYFGAAGSLGLCAEMVESDAGVVGGDREELTDRYCRRALEILNDAQQRFDDDGEAQALIADAYVSVGDSFKKAGRSALANQSWRLAHDMFVAFSNENMSLSASEIDDRIQSVEKRLHQKQGITKSND